MSKPTLEEYKELGAELSFLCNRLTSASIRVAELTGVSKDPYKHIKIADKRLSKCKSDLEDQLFRDYPELGREGIKIFYGEIKLPFDLQYKIQEKSISE